MAVDKLVDSAQLDSDLGDIAIAIRTKGGTSAQLTFPSGFISAIEAITTGITPTGTINITQSGNTDVTNYATANVASGSASTPSTSITANPTISVSASGLITASVSGSKSVTPSVSAGYVASGTAGTVTVSGSNTQQLTVYNGEHHQPVPSDYTVTISLTNPVNDYGFISCTLYDATTYTQIGSIASATGQATVLLNVGSSLKIEFSGACLAIESSGITCTNGITMTSYQSQGPLVFSVTASGTITIDGIDYDD